LRIISFWGKGGVGKTTCSASLAVRLAKGGHKVLLVTSDPTPSLSDILGVELGPDPRVVSGSLYAAELDEDAVVERWKRRFGKEVYDVVSSFLPVGEEVIDYIAGAPGIGFEFMLWYILDKKSTGEYDFIVWDTAPAGGALSLVKLEEQLYSHLGDAAAMYLRVKSTLDKIRRKERADPLKLISSWRKLAEDVLGMLASPEFEAYIVTIPEWLGYTQAKRIMQELAAFSIRVRKVIVNQVFQREACSCKPWVRKSEVHARYLELLEREFGKSPGIIVIPMLPEDIQGEKKLLEFSEYLKGVS